MIELAWLAAFLAVVGLLQSVAGWNEVRRFMRRRRTADAIPPPVTVLKPLYGAEPLLEEALATLCQQDYPTYQIVFGVQNPADPAISVVHRLQQRFPGHAIDLVINSTPHGANRKVANLINMREAARHPVLVIADSDVHVRPDYLRRLVEALDEPETGLVCTLYAGLPAARGMVGRLGATQITHGFLPGALLGRRLRREDCLGATMMIRSDTLDCIGGLEAVVPHLADDNVLGRLVHSRGLHVRLADTVPLTTVPETTMRALFEHELRWARTVRALVPWSFALSAIQYPIGWAILAVLLAGGAAWSLAVLALVWSARAMAATGIDRQLQPQMRGLAPGAPVWLLPVRDTMSLFVMVASYAGRRVTWRGHSLDADEGRASAEPVPYAVEEGLCKL